MATSASATAQAAHSGGQPALGSAPGVLPSQELRAAIHEGWIHSAHTIRPEAVQPASLDLRIGEFAWPLRCSFLPDSESTVEEKIAGLAFDHTIDLRDGATLERDRPYLVPLLEEVALPADLRAKANPKSSTGRLDVFTRVLTDRNHRFDEVRPGYRGRLYLEIVPRTFAIQVRTGLALNQLRVMRGAARMDDEGLRSLQSQRPLLYCGGEAVGDAELSISDGLFLSIDLSEQVAPAGYRARRNSLPIDLSRIGHYRWNDFWDPVFPEPGQRLVLEPEVFYLLISAEGVSIPPAVAAEMMAYDPTAGELRTHYAGFFDPGFGFSRSGEMPGSRAALEVRARDVPFMVEHRQPVCKLAFERMAAEPDVLYGEGAGSNYQGQVTMLSKHFTEHGARA